jgi:hypothetical protein
MELQVLAEHQVVQVQVEQMVLQEQAVLQELAEQDSIRFKTLH